VCGSPATHQVSILSSARSKLEKIVHNMVSVLNAYPIVQTSCKLFSESVHVSQLVQVLCSSMHWFPGFAFVEFEDDRDAEDAVRGLDGTTICGNRVRVEHSTGKSMPCFRRKSIRKTMILF
jgi:hypothetical protein